MVIYCIGRLLVFLETVMDPGTVLFYPAIYSLVFKRRFTVSASRYV